MPVLWIPDWQYSPTWSVPRQYCWGFALQWQPMHVVSYGRVTILEEEIFGGFRTHITFKENWWEWVSSNWDFEKIFEDFYVTFPGSETPANALNQHLSFTVSDVGLPVLKASQPGTPGATAYLKFPHNPPSGYWLPPDITVAPDFYIVPDL